MEPSVWETAQAVPENRIKRRLRGSSAALFIMKVKYDLLVLGAGGTGTYFLKEFSRYIAGNKSALKQIREMVIMDGDRVEEKNLVRQCFYPEDIGREKAVVMAGVLNDAFELSWQAYPQYLLDTDMLNKLLPTSHDKPANTGIIVPIIISCVDNHAARLVVEKFFDEAENCIVFDSANEFENGETVFSYKMQGKVLSPCRSAYFPDMKKGDLRNVTEVSCEELNQAAPQHIFTNMAAGLVLCSAAADLLEGNARTGWCSFNPFRFSMEYYAGQSL